MKLFTHWKDSRWAFEVEREGERLVVRCGDERIELQVSEPSPGMCSVMLNDRKLEFGWSRRGENYLVVLDGTPFDMIVRDLRSEQLAGIRETASAPGHAEIRAPIPGLLRKLLVKEGDEVQVGQALLILEAMKMENEIASPVQGVVREVRAEQGRTVERGRSLLLIGPRSPPT